MPPVWGCLPAEFSCNRHGNQRNTDCMEELPPNMMLFAPFDGLPPLQEVDQTMMRRLREFSNRKGGNVEDVIRQAIEQFVVKCGPKGNSKRRLSDFRNAKTSLVVHSLRVLQLFTASQLLP